MSPFLRQFMLISIIGMTILMLSLLLFYIDMNQDYLEDHLDAHNLNLAAVLRNSLVSSELETQLAQKADVLPPELQRQIVSTLDKELRSVPVAKVKIFSKDALVLFSSDEMEIGSSAANNPGVLHALKGQSKSSVVIRDRINPFDKLVEKRNLHQQYIPIKSSSDDLVIGVFEVYTDITEILEYVSRRQLQVFWGIAVIMVLFYIALLASFMKTHRVMVKEKKQRKDHLRALQRIQEELEERVFERTRELNETKNFLQSVIDGIGNPLMVIRPDFKVSLMNQAARDLVPADADPEQYQNCYQISHRRDQPCEEPDHPCSFAEVMNSGCKSRTRHTHFDADNNPVIVDLLTTPLYSADGNFEGVIEVEHDITQLVEAQENLAQSQAHLQTIMGSVPDAILTCDKDCRILSANHAGLDLFRCQESDLLNVSFSDFFTRDVTDDVFTDCAHRQTEEVLKRRDGDQFPAEIWVGPMPLTDDDSRYVVVVRDISRRVQARQELEATRQQYFHQDKMAAIGYLAAGILHEVGNPIAAIAGATSEMQSSMDNQPEEAKKCPYHDQVSQNLKMIDEQTQRLGNIITDIANFASPRAQDRQLIDLNALIQSTVQIMAYDKRFKTVEMQLDLDKQLPAIEAVPDQLTQVFMNLLLNAKDAFDDCDCQAPDVRISSQLDNDRVVVTIEDNGCGMSADTLDHATEAFFTTKPVGKGSGLGLSLCNKIVDMHGGELQIDSEENKGTRVRVILPVESV